MAVDRKRLARTIARELRERERSNLVAVGVFGSVARGEDRAFSDVDLLVITRKVRRGIRSSIREGVFVSIHQLTPGDARREATEGPWLNGPLTGWRETRALYDPAGFIARTRALALRPTAAAFRESARRDLIATVEDYGKVRNAVAAGDLEEAREMALWFTGSAMGSLLDIEGRVPRIHRREFQEVRRLGGVGRDVWRLRYDARTLAEIDRLSRRVWTGLLARARKRGVRIPEFDAKAGRRVTRSGRVGPSRGP